MNPLSATSIAGATVAAAFAGALVITMLSHPAALPAASGSLLSKMVPSPGALVPAAPMLHDCAPFAPAGPEGAASRGALLLANNDTSAPPNNAAPNELTDRRDQKGGGCDPEGELGVPPGFDIGGLGAGWIISADGVMRMNPYSLSDTHSIAVRPAEPLREFKGRVIGLGRGATMPQGGQSQPQGKEPRPLLVVGPAGAGASPAAGSAETRGRLAGPAAFAFAAAMVDPSPTRRDRV